MSDQRFRDSLRRFIRQVRTGHLGRAEPVTPALTPEWAESIDARMTTVERQLKLLNATLITGILADITLRLIPK